MLPFIGLGVALQSQGHEVRLYGNGAFTALVERSGLRYVETSEAQLLRDALADRRATSSSAGMALIAEGAVATTLPTMQAMALDVVVGRTLLIGSTLAFSPRLLAELQGLPFAAVHLSPSVFRSTHAMSHMPLVGSMAGWPRFVKRALWSIVDRSLLDPLFAAPLNRIRSELGLPAIRRVMRDWIHEGSLNIGLFPEWFAPRQPDWPAHLRLTGFPLYDTQADRHAMVSEELAAFIGAGPPPIVFTAGTANTTSQAFYAESVDACRRLRIRGVMASPQRSQLPDQLPESVIHVPYAPFSRLFASAAAVVHHGGIGTLSQALKAGVPQLIRPMAYDQFDNASRAVTLGVAQVLSVSGYRGRRLDDALTALQRDAAMRSACRSIAARMSNEDGLKRACDALAAKFVLPEPL